MVTPEDAMMKPLEAVPPNELSSCESVSDGVMITPDSLAPSMVTGMLTRMLEGS